MFLRTDINSTSEHRTVFRSGTISNSKRGSYIVEAAITLPLFLIAVLVMSSVILMYACIESSSFAAAGELRRCSAEAIYADTSVMLPYRLKKEIKENSSRVESARVTDFGYRVSRWGQDDLIALTIDMRLRSPNPLGIRASADYDLALVTRAYVGKVRNNPAMSADELSGTEKYHSKGCGFLTAASTSGVLTGSIRAKYRPCPLCGSGRASSGARIYYFPSAGEAYHLSGCSALQRNYVEIDKKDAIERGYTPCSKCGG